MTDPISDMLSRIKNALNSRAEAVDIPHSRIKEEIAKVLVSEGYIFRFDVLKKMERKYLRCTLKYNAAKKAVISGLRRVSVPGRRIYLGKDKLPRVHAGFGTAIISTSRGIKTDEEARAEGPDRLCHRYQ